MEDEFYLVWNLEASTPRCKHHTYEEAETEAKRLASLNPGNEFYIVKALAVAKRIEPVTVMKLSDGIPF